MLATLHTTNAHDISSAPEDEETDRACAEVEVESATEELLSITATSSGIDAPLERRSSSRLRSEGSRVLGTAASGTAVSAPAGEDSSNDESDEDYTDDDDEVIHESSEEDDDIVNESDDDDLVTTAEGDEVHKPVFTAYEFLPTVHGKGAPHVLTMGQVSTKQYGAVMKRIIFQATRKNVYAVVSSTAILVICYYPLSK